MGLSWGERTQRLRLQWSYRGSHGARRARRGGWETRVVNGGGWGNDRSHGKWTKLVAAIYPCWLMISLGINNYPWYLVGSNPIGKSPSTRIKWQSFPLWRNLIYGKPYKWLINGGCSGKIPMFHYRKDLFNPKKMELNIFDDTIL